SHRAPETLVAAIERLSLCRSARYILRRRHKAKHNAGKLKFCLTGPGCFWLPNTCRPTRRHVRALPASQVSLPQIRKSLTARPHVEKPRQRPCTGASVHKRVLNSNKCRHSSGHGG